MKLGSFHSYNKISQFQEKYLLTLNFCLICLGIIGRVKMINKIERNKCVEKIKACKQKLSELKKYENIIKKTCKKINKFLKI
jgi:inorganic pyrophosphatase